jgi:hypothetical protein
VSGPSVHDIAVQIVAACDAAAPGATGERWVVEASPWREDDATLDELYETWSERWAALVDVWRGVLGEPTYDDEGAREDIDVWYAEAMRIACWRRDDRTLYLALEHADRETPIAITTGWISDVELETLR